MNLGLSAPSRVVPMTGWFRVGPTAQARCAWMLNERLSAVRP